MDRREFLTGAAGLAVSLDDKGPARGSVQMWAPRKAMIFQDLQAPNRSMEDRFKIIRDLGFQGVESAPIHDRSEARRMRTAAESAGIRVHSIIYGGWNPPLSHPDPAQREQSRKNAELAIQSAHDMGADCVLLVPAVVNASTRYESAWKLSSEQIKRLVPFAARHNVRIDVEEVWNNFLLSPLEFARYIDSFRSRWLQAYFDVGNVVRFAWPEDWIRTLGRRIRKVHIKDFKGGPGLGTGGQWVNLWEGSIDWPEVRRALMEIGFTDYLTVELGGGNEAFFKDVSGRVDRIIAGA
jgi:hexulose-6-phosphate isomerase